MLSLTQVEALAPDQAALAAAAKLLKPAGWPLLARTADASVVWGEAQGSGSAPYRLMFDPADRGHKCSCPSRKFPCKHVLALMWQFVEHGERFAVGDPAPWVSDWLSRRRTPQAADRSAARPADAAKPAGGASLAALEPAAVAEPDSEIGPEAAIDAARRRERTEATREAAVSLGLEALETWLADQLNAGLAGFAGRSQGACRAAAQRLVNAKAPTLATRLDALPGALLGRPEALRADFMLGELGRLALIAAAWRRRERLDDILGQDLRRAIGWTSRREEILADPATTRVTATWIVAGVRVVVQPDRLRRIETWLVAAPPGEGADAAGEPRVALLLDFVPVQGGAAAGDLPAGERFEAELAYYPSPAPLRALIASRQPATGLDAAPAGGPSVQEAFAAHQARVARLPWLGDDLIRTGPARIASSNGGLWLRDDHGALPLGPDPARALTPLIGLELSGFAGIWDGQILAPLAASTPHGPWFARP